MRPRIYSDRCYIVGIPQGISGFPKPPVLGVVSGTLYRRDFHRFVDAPRMGNLNARQFRVEDGHLPDYQPRVSYDVACQWVLANPFHPAIAL